MRLQPATTDSANRPCRVSARRRHGFTLVEIMVSLGILAVTSMGSISAFMLLNKYAANLRNASMARGLCQERIEQALALPFRPSTGVVPSAPSLDPSNTAACTVLGAAANYSAAGAFTGASNLQTSTETIPLYTQQDGTAANKSASVVFTRTTNVSLAPLTNAGPKAVTASSLNVVQFTVTVSYVFRGQTYTTSMTTLRGPD